jgi:hypothetical protein
VGRRGRNDGDSGGGKAKATAQEVKVVKPEAPPAAPAGVITAKGVE